MAARRCYVQKCGCSASSCCVTRQSSHRKLIDSVGKGGKKKQRARPFPRLCSPHTITDASSELGSVLSTLAASIALSSRPFSLLCIVVHVASSHLNSPLLLRPLLKVAEDAHLHPPPVGFDKLHVRVCMGFIRAKSSWPSVSLQPIAVSLRFQTPGALKHRKLSRRRATPLTCNSASLVIHAGVLLQRLYQ